MAESSLFTEMELHRTGTEFCRMESPEPVSPRLSSESKEGGEGLTGDLGVRRKEEAL